MASRTRKLRPLASRLLERAARRRGFHVVVEPFWGIVVQITAGKKKRYLRYSSLDVNPLGASEVVKDKDYANFFMKKMGYPTVSGKAFYSPEWAKTIGSTESTQAAYAYAKKIGFPVFLKPNSGSQGRHIARVETKKEFDRALKEIFAHDRVALVQKPVGGSDYRIVVLGNEIMCVYKRTPLSVTGDGRHTIRELIEKIAQKRSGAGVPLTANDARIREKLARSGRTLRFVPKKGERIELLDVANLSSGGTAVDMTGTLHPGWKKIAASLTSDMGLSFAGIDIMTGDDMTKAPKKYFVLEVNASPGLDNYAALGSVQLKRVEKLYEHILTKLENS